MSEKKITVYQAMLDLKLMKKQLDTVMSELSSILNSSNNPYMKKDTIMAIPFVTIKTKGGIELEGIDLEDFKKTLQSNFDKYDHLIKNIESYSSAIAQSNATTKVTIAGVEYTVAEAIKRKELATHREKFLTLVKKQASFASYAVNAKNAEVENKWLETLKSLTQDGTLQLSDEYIEKQKKEFFAANTYELLDPMNHVEKIDGLVDAHNAFLNEVDTVLTTSNIQTLIDIKLED